MMRFWTYFLPVLMGLAVQVGAQSTRPGWGATPYSDGGGNGVTFRTWAPNASSVTVAGQFNGWNSGSTPLFNEGNGVWSRDVAGVTVGQEYKYVINGSIWRRDPYGRQIVADGTRNSIVYNPSSFSWGTNSFSMPAADSLVIYETHIGALYDPNPLDAQKGTFSNALTRLDHLQDLGINAIELMPISEFPTPTSWGYNLSYPFAIETSYGTPGDAKAFVKACHDRGIAVLMDVVHNHYGDDGNDWSLWQYDGWSSNGFGGIFFYNTTNFSNAGGWGPRPDYSRAQVRNYISENFRMWKSEYRIDGFRWDAPKYILYTDGTQTTPIPDGSNVINEVISMLSTQFPGTFNIAEDIKGVAGFDSHWDLNYQWNIQDVMSQSSDANRNMFTLATAIDADARRIVFTESHDTTGDLNSGQRLPKRIDSSNPESYWARKRTMLAAAITMTAAGTPMIWQGQEMYETNSFSDSRSLDWSRTNSFKQFTRLYRDLIHLRRNLDGVSPGLIGDGTTVSLIDNGQKILAYQRYNAAQPDDRVVVLINAGSTERNNLQIQFPHAGTWYVHVNTDDTVYGDDYGGVGAKFVTATGSPAVASVNLGWYSAQILSQTPVSGLVLQQLTVSDATDGNGNGIPEPGETLRITASLKNKGQNTATNVNALLSAAAPGVFVTQPTALYPDIGADSVATGDVPFSVVLPTNWPCGSPVNLALAASFSAGNQEFPISLSVGLEDIVNVATSRPSSVDIPKAILDSQTITSLLNVTNGVSSLIDRTKVWLRINHTFDRDMIIKLKHPDGTEVLLSNRRGSFRDNYGSGTCGIDAVYTVFDSDAATSISQGTAPFAGSYRPEGNLYAFAGKSPVGTWTLSVEDVDNSDQGTLLCWGVEVVSAEHINQCQIYYQNNPDIDGDGLPDWWEVLHGGGPTNMTGRADDDLDGLSNAEEFRAGTNPTNDQSVLRVERFTSNEDITTGFVIRWQSAPDHSYRILRNDGLVEQPFVTIESNIPATPAQNTYTDSVIGAEIRAYRIEVQ